MIHCYSHPNPILNSIINQRAIMITLNNMIMIYIYVELIDFLSKCLFSLNN